MAASGKKDFSTDGLDILGIRKTAKPATETREAPAKEKEAVAKPAPAKASRAKQRDVSEVVRFTLPIRRENVEYLEAIKALEGTTITEILNGILDEHRARGQEALDRALAQLEASRRAWRGDA